MGFGLGHFLLAWIVVWGSLAFADGEKSLCEQMVEAAQQAQLYAPFEIEFFDNKNSKSIMAFETTGEGKMAWEIEFVLTGFNNQILRIKAYRRNKDINFNDNSIPRILLARVLATNPQIQIIRETWIADELPEVIRSLKANKTPREALENTFRARLYRSLGFTKLVKMGLDFDERDSMILFDVDFASETYQAPRNEPELSMPKDAYAGDKKAEHIRKLMSDLLKPDESSSSSKPNPEDSVGN